MKVLALFCIAISVNNAKNIYLSSSDNVLWTFINLNGSISGNASVPGGVYTDLQNAGIIGDILYGFNDVYTRWVAKDTWTYTAKFKVQSDNLNSRVIQVVFEGLDTTAFVELNSIPIGTANNMFVRYTYDVKEAIQAGENVLKVTFISPVESAQIRSNKYFTAPTCVPDLYNGECHANQLRKMQASFGWDWGPAFPSVGIWKPVYIEMYNGAIIKSLTTHADKIGSMWNLRIKVHIESGLKATQIKGVLTASLKLEGQQTVKKWLYYNVTTRHDGSVEVDMDLAVSQNVVRLWWPNGYGPQPLYDLDVYLTSDEHEHEVSHKNIAIGFRTIELLETNASLILGNETAGATGLAFYFRVNGYPIFMKGSNWIPANILPELGEKQSHVVDNLLLAARDTHMNMLRVWGGGVYESDYFYKKCDELGILIWQDFLFACSMYPVDSEFLETVKEEIEQNVIRLQHHPSIAVWAGNNENEAALIGNWYNTRAEFNKYKNEYIKLYVTTIKPIVEELDPGRRYLISSPSNGVKSEQSGYVALNPYDPHYGDTHYYNYIADNWDMNIYPKTRFASEYGFQSLPSIATMKTATNITSDFALDSLYSEHRQHSPGGYGFITRQIEDRLDDSEAINFEQYIYHSQEPINDLKEPRSFQKFIYQSQISQAMSIKAETEYYRQSQADWYTMGALYWQLNDVWQAPSWSSIEYGGRWKMLHYYAKLFFAPVLVSPRLGASGDVTVYLINDRFVPINDAKIFVDVFKWNNLTSSGTKSFDASVGALSSKLQDINVNFWEKQNKDEIFLRFSLKAPSVKLSPYNYIFPKPLKSIVGLNTPNIQIKVSDIVMRLPNHKLQYTVNISVDTIVLFLWLETDLEGIFDDNGIIVTEPTLHVKFVCNRYVPRNLLEESIKFQYYMN